MTTDSAAGGVGAEMEPNWYVLVPGEKKRGPYTLAELKSHFAGVRFYSGLRVRTIQDRRWIPWVDAGTVYPELLAAGIVDPNRKTNLAVNGNAAIGSKTSNSPRGNRTTVRVIWAGSLLLVLAVVHWGGLWTDWRISWAARTLVSGESHKRDEAASYLAEHLTPAGREALRTALAEERDHYVRRIAVRAIGGDPQSVDSALLAFSAVHDVDADVRERAIDALGRLGDVRTLAQVSFAARHDSARAVRKAGLIALGGLGDRRSVHSIVRSGATLMLDKGRWETDTVEAAETAQEALGRLRGPIAEPLRRLLVASPTFGDAPKAQPGEPGAELGMAEAAPAMLPPVPPAPLFYPTLWDMAVSGIPPDEFAAAHSDRIVRAQEPSYPHWQHHKHFDGPELRDAELLLTIRLVVHFRDSGAIPVLAKLAEARPEAVYALADLGSVAFVDKLVQLLGSADDAVADAAVDALPALGVEVIGPVLAALDESDRTRIRIARVFERVHDKRVIDPLLGLLKSGNPQVRIAALMALGNTSHHQVGPAVAARLRDEHDGVREVAVRAVAKLRAEGAEAAIIHALRDDSPEVRVAAARALTDFDSVAAISALAVASEDHERKVRFAAAEGLLSRRDPRAIPVFVERMADWHEGRGAVRSLEHVFDWTPETDLEIVRYHVALRNKERLVEMWSTTRQTLLREMRSDDYAVVENALFAFIGLGREEVIPDLKRVIDDHGTKVLAEAYLNSGHPDLHRAGERWTYSHGYSINRGPGAAPIGWGRM